MKYIVFDVETYCELDLKKVNLKQYVNHSSFKVLTAVTQDETGHVSSFTEENMSVLVKKLKTTDSVLVAHNIAFDLAALHIPITQKMKLWDTQTAAKILNAPSSLSEACSFFLGVSHKDKMGWKRGVKFVEETDPLKKLESLKSLLDYNRMDVEETSKLFSFFIRTFPHIKWDSEMKQAKYFYMMNENGIPIDAKYLLNFSISGNRISFLQKKIMEQKYSINMRSPKQVRAYVESVIGVRKTKELFFFKGKYQFNKKHLSNTVIPSELKEFFDDRYDTIPAHIKKADKILNHRWYDRLYYAYSYYGSSTGRPTSRRYNILNLPKGKRHSIFEAPMSFRFATIISTAESLAEGTEDYLKDNKAWETYNTYLSLLKTGLRGGIGSTVNDLIISDYSQLEPRVAAAELQQKNIITKVKKGIDIYTEQAIDVFGSKDYRSMVKQATMSYLYGGSVWGIKRLCSQYGITDDLLVENFIESMDRTWTKLRGYYTKALKTAISLPSKKTYVLSSTETSGTQVLYKTCLDKIMVVKEGNFRCLIPIDQQFGSRMLANNIQSKSHFILKMLRTVALQRGLKVVMDEHDKIVVETDNYENDINVLKYCMNIVVDKVNEGRRCQILLDSDVKQTKWLN